MKVFGNGFLDVINDVFWMPPFSSVRQAQLVCQDHNITMDDWSKRREKIMDEHSKSGAREQLALSWNSWVASKPFQDFQERIAVAADSATAESELVERDE